MAVTTYRSFVDGIINLDITGIDADNNYDRIPSQVSNLPARFIRLPQGNEGPLTADGEGGWPRLRCDIVILVEAAHQNYDKPNYDLTITLIDALCTTLRAVSPGDICKSKLSWTITPQLYQLNDVTYWSIIAQISGNG